MQDNALKELEAQKFRKAALKHLESQGQRVNVNGTMMGSVVEKQQIDNTLQLLLRQSASDKKKQEENLERKGLLSSRSAVVTDNTPAVTSNIPSATGSNIAVVVSNQLAPLPTNWKAVFDEGIGKTYYWNTETNETSWDRPATAAPASLPPTTPVSSASTSTHILPAGWEERVHPATKQIYYFHATTKQTSHTPPTMPPEVSKPTVGTADGAAGSATAGKDNAKKRKIEEVNPRKI
ncbi:hypothetical protein EON65_30990 [archaeon]|nr:MAG: hypothetical protein EON65_30990 [archaeon]